MKKTLFSLLLLVVSVVSFTQNRYKPGYIIKNNGDTLIGFVEERNWDKTPLQINFNADKPDAGTAYGAPDILGFGIDGVDNYRSATLTLDMRPVTLSELVRHQRDSVIEARVFLRVLVNGDKTDLFELISHKPHYIIQHEGKMTELKYRTHFDEVTGSFLVTNGFHDQLRAVFPSADAHRIGNLRYQRGDLVRFFADQGDATLAVSESNTQPQVNWLLGGGAVFGRVKFQGDDKVLNSISNDTYTQPVFTVGIDVFPSRIKQNVFFRLALSISGAEGFGTGKTVASLPNDNLHHTYRLKQSNITPSGYANFVFVRSGRTFGYFGAGFGLNFSSYSQNSLSTYNERTGETTTETFPETKKTWVNIGLRAGVVINRRIDISATASIAGTFVEYLNITETSKPAFLTVHYRFGK